MHCLTFPKYFFICSSLASHVPFTWPITNWESPWTRTESAPSDFTSYKPWSRTLYSASLLVVWNYRQTAYSKWSPSGECRTRPIPPACCMDEPSTWKTHCFTPCTSLCCSLEGVNSAMKYARTWAFIVSLGLYRTSNSLSSTARWISCPTASSLFMAFFSGWSVRTLVNVFKPLKTQPN